MKNTVKFLTLLLVSSLSLNSYAAEQNTKIKFPEVQQSYLKQVKRVMNTMMLHG